MKKILTLTSLLACAGAHGATLASSANSQGSSGGVPIVDNTGTPIAAGSANFQFGTFSDDFINNVLGTLDTRTDDMAVIDAFEATGSSAAFTRDGLFGTSKDDLDGDGSLGAAGRPLFGLVTFSPDGGDTQALVINYGVSFPEQSADGNGAIEGVVITRDNVLSLVVFGDTQLTEGVDTSGYPTPLQTEAFSQGIKFDAIPEPSTSLLAGFAALALLGRRRR